MYILSLRVMGTSLSLVSSLCLLVRDGNNFWLLLCLSEQARPTIALLAPVKLFCTATFILLRLLNARRLLEIRPSSCFSALSRCL